MKKSPLVYSNPPAYYISLDFLTSLFIKTLPVSSGPKSRTMASATQM